MKHTVTCVLKFKEKILIMKRSQKVGSFQGFYGMVAGYIEPDETPDEAAIKEVEEEAGLRQDQFKLIKKGEPFKVAKDGRSWVVHPYLFEVNMDEIKIDWEHDNFEWILPKDLKKYNYVPGLDKIIEMFL